MPWLQDQIQCFNSWLNLFFSQLQPLNVFKINKILYFKIAPLQYFLYSLNHKKLKLENVAKIKRKYLHSDQYEKLEVCVSAALLSSKTIRSPLIL